MTGLSRATPGRTLLGNNHSFGYHSITEGFITTWRYQEDSMGAPGYLSSSLAMVLSCMFEVPS